MKQYVQNGLVNYQALLQAENELDAYLDELRSISMDRLGEASREERIAFWINLYNASVIQMVLDEYPVERFDQLPAAFEVRTIRALGDFFSLSEVRDRVLRQGFRDERILMALVSGRMDSPKLFSEAFYGDRLEEQLNEAAHKFVEDETRNRIEPGEKKIFLSPLFRDFGSDFLLNFSSQENTQASSAIEAAVISFFLHHMQDPRKRLFLDSGRYKVQYLPEDPRLNAVH